VIQYAGSPIDPATLSPEACEPIITLAQNMLIRIVGVLEAYEENDQETVVIGLRDLEGDLGFILRGAHVRRRSAGTSRVSAADK
jgi:hypothetical protein